MDTLSHICVTILHVLLFVNHGSAENSFMFLAPSTIRPGRVFTIEGGLLEVPRRSVTVTASLRDKDREIASNEVVVNGKESVSLDLQVPGDLVPSAVYRLIISGTGELSFRNEKTLQYEGKSSSVFIQTDKAVYKPGQKVHFRVFGVTPELKVIFDKVKVELYDPKGNKIQQWDVSGAEMLASGGVLVRQQQLSQYPILGTWTLKASLLSYGEKFEEQTFKVDEYVLPKFEVELDLPAFGRTSDSQFEGKVTAKYTFGKPVKGEVSLRIKPQSPSTRSATKEIELQFPIEGTASFTVPLSQLEGMVSSLDQKTLHFEANVTEGLTKSRQTDSQGVTFYKIPYKVVFPKSLPNTYKPGMTYNAVVKVAMRDDTPPDQVTDQLKVIVTEVRRTRSFEPRRFRSHSRWWHPPRPRDVKKQLAPSFHDIPIDGVVEVPVKVDNKPFKIEIKAEYGKASAKMTLKKRHSPSNSYLQITQVSPAAKAGEKAEFKIQRTSSTADVNYQIYSKGSIVDSGTVPRGGMSSTWRPLMTSAMAPKSRIVVFYVRGDGEVVADALSVNVEGIFENKVTVDFNNTNARPKDGISLNIRADPGSRVNVLGVDKSVLLMGTGNDVTKTEVIQELQSFDTKTSKSRDRDDVPFCDWFCWRWPVSVGGEDVKDVFQDSGILVLTDANVYEHRETVRPPPDLWRPMALPRFELFGVNRRGPFGAVMMRNRRPMARMARMQAAPMMAESGMRLKSAPKMDMSAMLDTLPPPDQKELAPVTRTRRLFPETWLWLDTTIPSSGITTVTETVPDTITSWLATAFAIHPTSGLGISENSANLQVSMPFFVTLNLPYSVVRGEKVVIQVNIHNYSPENLFSFVELSKSVEFDNIEITELSQTTTSADVTRTVTVASGSVASVYFPIIPRKLGRVDIKIKAQTTLMSDAITKQLLVEPEGTEREYNLPVVIDLKETRNFSSKVNIEFPKSTVAGSQRVKATAIGDIMGPSITGLDKLLKMPYGCGEQNMLKFAPNIFIMKYLEKTGKVDAEIKQKAIDFMETGYQRELGYAHSDGSYSAFGDRDPSGSTWLTAFVLKSFVQATPYIYVDEKVIKKAVTFLVQQQNKDGTFNEPGRVLHKGMQGGSTAGKVSLTAYVLISLLEARVVENVKPQVSEALDKAQVFLEGKVGGLTDVYDLAIVAYALTLANSTQTSTVWLALNTKAIEQGGRKHWEKKAKVSTATKPWTRRTGSAIDIELTAYALLGLAIKQDRLEGSKVLNWLTESRNQDGGFVSTQDTVIALQSLAEMASLITSPVYDVTVVISGSGWTETFIINDINARVLQSRKVPNDPGEVTISATGRGFALAQLEVVYNIDDDGQKESFQLTTHLPRETMNNFDVKVCARWLEKGSSSMALIEIGSPSGFYPDLASLVTEPAHKRVEIETRKTVLYFDEIDATDTCVHVTMQRVAMVAGAQPVAVRVMDYYDPGRSVTEFYIPTTLVNSNVCDVCIDCDFCTATKPSVH